MQKDMNFWRNLADASIPCEGVCVVYGMGEVACVAIPSRGRKSGNLQR